MNDVKADVSERRKGGRSGPRKGGYAEDKGPRAGVRKIAVQRAGGRQGGRKGGDSRIFF